MAPRAFELTHLPLPLSILAMVCSWSPVSRAILALERPSALRQARSRSPRVPVGLRGSAPRNFRMAGMCLGPGWVLPNSQFLSASDQTPRCLAASCLVRPKSVRRLIS